MSWFRKLLPPKIKRESTQAKKAVPEGLWSKCPSCEAVLYFTDLENNLHVCPKCGFHNRLTARQRLDLFLDAEGRAELASEVIPMAKTTAALHQLTAAKQPFISILTDPTMGGVSASFAFIGDAVLAEPGALIGFAGPRVIEQTVRETLPEGFQRSEFLLEKGAIDMIVDRRKMRDKLPALLAALQGR